MSAGSWETNHQFETLTGLSVSFEASVDQAFVVDVADDIHGRSVLLEGCHWLVND